MNDRVGVWGLSYGGFFTLIAITDQPKMFRAAVDVAGVVDYAMYYEDPYHGGWTASRIGTPEQNPKVYANASPISKIDRLETPLLVLHGTADVNVPYLHSVRLLDEAMKKNKSHLIEFMTYPGEFHYFTREHVLRDAWRRVDEFLTRTSRVVRRPPTRADVDMRVKPIAWGLSVAWVGWVCFAGLTAQTTKPPVVKPPGPPFRSEERTGRGELSSAARRRCKNQNSF